MIQNVEIDAQVTRSRTVERLITGQPTSDGAGVTLTRVLTHDLQRRLDPFLMLDAFGSDDPDDYIAGFPDHPHRGFETVTYMIAGRMRHRDSTGNEGLLEPGGVQWMTAGRGVIHSEIPEQSEGRMEGFQLWLNLAARDKLCAPWYRDFKSDELPRVSLDGGGTVTVIAGHSHAVEGAVTRAQTEPLFLDVHLPAKSQFSQPLAPGSNAFVYVYRGAARIEDTAIPAQRMAVLRNEPLADGVIVVADEPVKLLLIAGQPLNEPIAQYGPFVMNTQQELQQAFVDYRAGRLGA